VEEAKDRSLTVQPAKQLPAGERAEVMPALEDASLAAFRIAIAIGAALVIAGGVASLAGIQNPRRPVASRDCPGGAIVGASAELAR
jgi:hypothetical protein